MGTGMRPHRWIPRRVCTFLLCAALTATALLSQNTNKPVAPTKDEDHGVVDPRTKLTWMPWDNGKSVTWPEAKSYCGSLEFDSHRDWRLPAIEEIEEIYDSKAPHLTTIPVQITTDWLWSATKTNMHGGNWGTSAWLFSFVSGRRIEHGVLTFRAFHALCVRDPQD